MLRTENNIFNKIGVVGGGAWGTALANLAAANGADVILYCREAELVEEINTQHKNSSYLPGIAVNTKITATDNLFDLQKVDLLLLAVPTQQLRNFILSNSNFKACQPVLICSKGIENSTLKCLSEVVLEFWEVPVMALAGPNFADEIACGRIAAATIATSDKSLANRAIKTLSSEHFKLEWSADIRGVQILGAAKNVLAIAGGMVSGMMLGENCRAALITYGLREACQLLKALDADEQTAMGLAGVGDLILTTYSMKSRNSSFGYKIGQGACINDLLQENKTVEGYYSCKSLHHLCKKHDLDLPIINAMHEILYNNADIESSLKKFI